MASITEQLAALATMPPAQLRTEWRRLHQQPPPVRLTPDLLRRGIAYRLQERVHGGLPTHIARELDRLVRRRLAEIAAAATTGAEGDGGTAAASTTRRPNEPRLRPGTRLVRSWQGRRPPDCEVDRPPYCEVDKPPYCDVGMPPY